MGTRLWKERSQKVSIPPSHDFGLIRILRILVQAIVNPMPCSLVQTLKGMGKLVPHGFQILEPVFMWPGTQNIKQFTHFHGPDQIFIGNGEGLSISNTGFSSFISRNDVGITFKLHKLLHLPSILKNLLSVSQFGKDNSVFYEFHPHVCLVKSQKTNKSLLRGVVGVDGLYSFHNLKLQESTSLLMFASTVSSVVSPSSALTINNNNLL